MGESRYHGRRASPTLITGLVLLIIGLGNVVPAQNSARDIWDGVYGMDQADRGRRSYMRHCVECHAEDLSGDTPYNPSPQLAGRPFLLRWNKRTLGDLFTLIQTTMPQDKPGALDGQTYVDIVAFLLRSNAFPPGVDELGEDTERLKTIYISGEK